MPFSLLSSSASRAFNLLSFVFNITNSSFSSRVSSNASTSFLSSVDVRNSGKNGVPNSIGSITCVMSSVRINNTNAAMNISKSSIISIPTRTAVAATRRARAV